MKHYRKTGRNRVPRNEMIRLSTEIEIKRNQNLQIKENHPETWRWKKDMFQWTKLSNWNSPADYRRIRDKEMTQRRIILPRFLLLL